MDNVQSTDLMPSLGSTLVVGGCGFLGHQIAKTLLENHTSNDISVLDIKTDRNRLPGVNYYDGDICSKSDILSVLTRIQPKVIFHTASPPAPAGNLDLFMRVNVLGTRNLLECSQDTRTVLAFIYTSAASVLNDSVNDSLDVDENSPVLYMPIQKSPYGHSKAVAESLVLKANRQNGKMLTTAIRPSGLFGENDLTAVKPMVNAAVEGKHKYQIGDGRNLFDWTYIGNAVHAHILAAQALLKASNSNSIVPTNEVVDGETFLITNDEAIPFWDFARGLGTAAGYPTKAEEIRVIPRIVGLAMATIAEWVVWISSFGRKKSSITRGGIRFSTMTRTFRIDKAKRRLGYKPLVSMQEGMRRAGHSYARDAQKTK